MSQWQGFDQRKICPECGGYHTKLSQIEKEQNNLEKAILVLVILFITFLVTGFLAFLFVRQVRLGQSPNPALIFPFLILLTTLLFSRRLKDGVRESYNVILYSSREEKINSTWTGYHLHCLDCGHIWEKSTNEWDAEKQDDPSTQ